jgi:hypothetical protein
MLGCLEGLSLVGEHNQNKPQRLRVLIRQVGANVQSVPG